MPAFAPLWLIALFLCFLVAGIRVEAQTDPAPDPAPAVGGSVAQAEAAIVGHGAIEPGRLAPGAEKAIAAISGPIERLFTALRQDAAAIRATWRRLSGLKDLDPAEAWRAARDIGPSVIVALLIAVGGRIALLRAFRWIGRAGRDGGALRKAWLILVKFALDLAIILLALVGFVAVSPGEGDRPPELAFVAALLVSGTLIAFIRAILSPAAPELRLVPMGDAGARYWTTRLGLVVVVIVFGEIFVATALREVVTPITARGVTMLFYGAAILYLIFLVVMNRHAPARHFGARAAAREDDLQAMACAVLARYWHWPVLAGLLFLLHEVLTAGASAVPVIVATAQIIAALAIAMLGFTLLDGLATQGITLAPRTRRLMPRLEARLNAFVPPFVRVLRLVLVVIWLLLVLQLLGIAQLLSWAQDRLHIDLIGTTTRLIATALMAFAAWLAIDGWVDFRLTPTPRHTPTPRERTLLTLLRNAGAVVIIVLGIYSALSDIGISLAPLLASAGVLALAISWGSQRLVQDVITGLFIQLENAINVGDVIEAAGKTGVVEKLTIRSVSLRDVEGVYHLIPFSAVDAVSNHTKGFSYYVADISIAYDADIDAAKAAMVAAYDDLATSPQWSLKLVGGFEWFGINALGDSAVVLRGRIKTLPGEQWGVGRAYSELVKRRFDAQSIEIPFPQMKLWIGDRAPDRPEESVGRPTEQTKGSETPTDAS